MDDTRHDPQTIAFYDREAKAYADFSTRTPQLDGFIAQLPAGAEVLELGCGAGIDSEVLIAAGMHVTATDGSAAMAALASERIGQPVRVMRFDELSDVAAYDGVWANACLLHAPADALPDVLKRIHRALRDGGVFFASFKTGGGEGRDGLGRYYNFLSRAKLERMYADAGPWRRVDMIEGQSSGYDGVVRPWLSCTAIKE